MTVIEADPVHRPPRSAAPAPAPAPRFRPNARRRGRIATALVLGAIAVAGNLVAYASLDDRDPVVQVVRDVPAGALITADALRVVEVAGDDSLNMVRDDELASILGQHAKVRLVAGSLLTAAQVQPGPLVAVGHAVVAVNVAAGTLPLGLRERVPVQLVMPTGRAADGSPNPPLVVSGRVVGLPSEPTSALGDHAVSIELAAADATVVAASDEVRVVLLPPEPDPAVAGSVGGAEEPAP